MFRQLFRKFMPVSSTSKKNSVINEAVINPGSWKRVGSEFTEIDIDKHRTEQKKALESWRADPIAKAVVDLTKYCVLGRGVIFRSEKYQDRLDDFVRLNNLQMLLT